MYSGMYNDLSSTLTSIGITSIITVIFIGSGIWLWKKRIHFTGGYIIFYAVIIFGLFTNNIINTYNNGNPTGAGGLLEIFVAIIGFGIFLLTIIVDIIRYFYNKHIRSKSIGGI